MKIYVKHWYSIFWPRGLDEGFGACPQAWLGPTYKDWAPRPHTIPIYLDHALGAPHCLYPVPHAQDWVLGNPALAPPSSVCWDQALGAQCYPHMLELGLAWSYVPDLAHKVIILGPPILMESPACWMTLHGGGGQIWPINWELIASLKGLKARLNNQTVTCFARAREAVILGWYLPEQTHNTFVESSLWWGEAKSFRVNSVLLPLVHLIRKRSQSKPNI